jgi:hypothetical protein
MAALAGAGAGAGDDEEEGDERASNALAVAKAAMKAAGLQDASNEAGQQKIVVQGQAAPDEQKREVPEEVAELSEEKTGSFRKLYQTKLAQLPKEQRAEIALMVGGDTLCAFCFDPWPGVIKSVLENPLSALQEARLIAQHHDKALGLDHLGLRAELLRDLPVQRYLLRNVQSSDPLLRKVLRLKPLHELFRLAMTGELTERAKRVARKTLRTKFLHSSAEERLALILKTEGRVLLSLTGIAFGEKLTALMCRRNYQSVPLIKNLATHAVTPHQVIRHLWKQQLVKRTKHLQVAILQHPNCPGEFKRR